MDIVNEAFSQPLPDHVKIGHLIMNTLLQMLAGDADIWCKFMGLEAEEGYDHLVTEIRKCCSNEAERMELNNKAFQYAIESIKNNMVLEDGVRKNAMNWLETLLRTMNMETGTIEIKHCTDGAFSVVIKSDDSDETCG